MRKLVLVRHAQPEIDSTLDAREWQLSIQGKRQSETLAESLREYDPTVVITSDESKAVQTGTIIAQRLSVSQETIADLYEHDRRGVPFFSEKGSFEELVARLFLEPQRLVFGNETGDQAYDRFAAAIEQVLKNYPEGNVVVVTHGTVLTLYVSRKVGLEPVSFWRSLGLPAAIVLELPDIKLEAMINPVDK